MAYTGKINIFSEAVKRHIRYTAGLAVVSGGLLLTTAPYAAGQSTTGDIVGTVTDTGGSIVPNATVTLTNIDTKEIRTAQTTGAGDFDFSELGPGNYSVKVQQNGFKTVEIPTITLSAGDRAREDAKLDVGSESQTVQVTAQTPALQTDSSVVESTVTQQAVEDLPLSGRNYINLVQITPGANEGPGNGLTSGNRPDDRRQTSAVVANGQSEVLNNQMVDGLDNNERIIGGIGIRPAIEAIKEINVQTNNYTAEVGRTGGAVVNIITRSGSNAFHGSAYEFFQNDVLNANPFQFAQGQPKPKQRQNQFGGSLGGPVVKDKVFFFAAYEGLRQITGQNPQEQQTVLPTEYATLHSGNNALISQMLAGGAPLDPAGLAYAQLYPLANTPLDPLNPNTQGFTASPAISRNSDTYDGRVDWQIDQKDLVYGRYTYNTVPSFRPSIFPTVNENGINIAPSGNVYDFEGTANDGAQNAQINFIRTVSPNVLVQLGFGFTRVNNESLPLNYGVNASAALGIPNINISPVTTGLTPVFPGGYGSLGVGNFVPIINVDNTFQEQASVTLNRGKQSIRIGAALIRRQAENVQNNFGIGSYSFNSLPGAKTGLSALLTGQFNSVERSNDLVPPHYRDWEPSVYVQDDYHAAQNLTLNIGLRYDVLTPFTEATANALTNFDPTSGRLAVAGRNGVNKYGGVSPTYTDIAPRLGFAVTPVPGFVVRGGFGISYYQGNYTSNGSEKAQPFVSDYFCNFSRNVPVAASTCPTNPATGGAGPTFLSQGLPTPTPSDPNNPMGNVNDVLNTNFRTSYVEGYNLGIEKSFGANVFIANYVGNLGRHLAQITNDQNAPALISNSALAAFATQQGLDQSTAFNLLRPYHSTLPNVVQIGQFVSGGASNYNAIQLSLTRRATAGLTVNANYTFAHGLDNVIAYSNEVGDGYGLVPTQLSSLEYGNSDLDLRQRAAVTANYQLPFGKTLTGFKAALGKGWQGNTLLRWQSGLPFTVLQGNGVGSTSFGATGNTRPNQLRKGNLSGFNATTFFDPTAFQPQLSGTVGTERRNPLYGPHFRQVDVSLFKSFPVYRESTIEFRTEVFNVINTTNFGNPNSFINSVQASSQAGAMTTNPDVYQVLGSNAGQITSLNGNYIPREIQFALKYQF